MKEENEYLFNTYTHIFLLYKTGPEKLTNLHINYTTINGLITLCDYLIMKETAKNPRKYKIRKNKKFK
jgi:hypothetical protein